jgi:hypothetical protein
MTVSASRVHFDEHTMTVDLTDGRTVRVPLAWFPRLLRAKPAQRAKVELSRVGLHWEELDEDISIAGLLAGHGDITKRTEADPVTKPAVHAVVLGEKRSAGAKLQGLDGRHRDTAGEIRRKSGSTRVGTLRKTYGANFAAGWRSDMKLEDLLKETGAKSLTDFRRKHNK